MNMVKRSVYQKIQKLKKGDIIHVKEAQKTYDWYDCNKKDYVAELITPETDVRVNTAKAPYVRKTRKGMHDYFVAGYAIINGEEFACGVDYENVAI